jgi:5'-nucleotidase
VPTTWLRVLALAGVITVFAACGSSDDSSDAPEKTQALSVLVTNDDGYDAPGLDAVVTELSALPGVTVTVVAPATDQSGTGAKTTPTPLTAKDTQTLNGFPAVAVEGFPADSVVYALDRVLPDKPDLVVSGVNEGPNFGPLATVSGTVGAAEMAASVGIPAIAASQGLGAPPDYASAAQIVAGWVSAHRAELAGAEAPVVVLNLNVPTCAVGTLRGVAQVPAAPNLDGASVSSVDCSSTATTEPKTDTQAFTAGFASVTSLQADGAPTTSTTVWSSR